MTDPIPEGIVYVGGPSDGRRHQARPDLSNVTLLPGVTLMGEPAPRIDPVLIYTKRYLPGGVEVMALEGLTYTDVLRRLVECYRP